MYDDIDYASTRLNDTVVQKVGGEAFYIHHLESEDGAIKAFGNVLDGDTESVNLSDLKLRGFKLGYFNKDGCALYLMRVPKRRDWRQGLRSNNVSCRRRSGNGITSVSTSTIMKALDYKYPTIVSAVKMLNKGWGSVALSSHYALVKTLEGYSIMFRGLHKVGEYDLERRMVTSMAIGHTKAIRLFDEVIHDT